MKVIIFPLKFIFVIIIFLLFFTFITIIIIIILFLKISFFFNHFFTHIKDEHLNFIYIYFDLLITTIIYIIILF